MYELALTAPYLLGERLVGAHAALGDTAGVDLLLEEPPYSSEQAMFAAVAAEGLGVTDVDPAVEPDGASWMEERPIGSWDVFTTLVTRLDGRTAVEASRAWAGGWETVYEDEAGDICVSWALAADDDAGRGTLSAALRSWVGAGPAGVAQVSEVEGGIIELAACDPGERAVSPDPVAVYDAVAWLLAHEDVVAGLASDVPIASADCAATRLLATLEPSDISFDGLAGETGRLVEAARRVRGCLPGRADRRGVAPAVHQGERTQPSITYRRGMDRAVLTTGANSGLGLAIAVELAKRGYRSIGSVRTKAKAAEVAREAKASGVEIETVLLDVKDAERCAEVIDDLELFGLVNNAGYSVTGAVEDTPDDEARDLLETMVVAPMRLARLALPGMRGRGEGRIVNISSIYGRFTTPFTGWYQAAKHGLEGVTDALRMEVAGMGVKVVLVEPGGFRTAIFDEVSGDLDRRGADTPYRRGYDRMLQTLKLSQPFLGDPQVVARVVAGAMSSRVPRARYLVGNDAQAAALTERFTPTFVKDLVTRRVMGL